MPHTPIQKLTIKNCGCIKSAEVNLTRLHALIGPNDSGKSTILRALRTATQFATGEFTRNDKTDAQGAQGWQGNQSVAGEPARHDKGEILPFTPLLDDTARGAFISLTLESSLEYQVGTGSSLLLVEEPENGLHPSRIRDVMNVLRKISESAQVVIATHSPLVINEMKPNEVTVVTRDAAGTHCMPIGKTKGFEDRIKVYALGELWLSYANGKDEAPLLNGGARE